MAITAEIGDVLIFERDSERWIAGFGKDFEGEGIAALSTMAGGAVLWIASLADIMTPAVGMKESVDVTLERTSLHLIFFGRPPSLPLRLAASDFAVDLREPSHAIAAEILSGEIVTCFFMGESKESQRLGNASAK